MSNEIESLGCRIILSLRSVMVVETLTRTGERPFKRVIAEYDSTNGKYDEAMRCARITLHNLKH